MKATNQAVLAFANEHNEDVFQAQKKLVEELKVQWKMLWLERFEDKVRAEGISVKDYTLLSVDRGTVIHATRNFKALSFREILSKHMSENPQRFIQPNTEVGGWNKFVKTQIRGRTSQRSRQAASTTQKKRNDRQPKGQPKKGGRGWLHAN